MGQTIRIGHCQLECKPDDLQGNIAKVIAGLEEADRRRLAIVSFPESFLTGYFESDEGFRAPGHNLALDGPEITDLLRHTRDFRATWMVGFNELREGNIYNTVLVAERGSLLDVYRKAFPCSRFETPGREFPVFERDGVKFGVVICADGGYIEPTRILVLKGAKIIFAPHYNYIKAPHVLDHAMHVRSDHIARATENGVWFLRGNNVVRGMDAGLGYEGVGYGESYLIDPLGEFVVRSRRHVEQMIDAEVSLDPETYRGCGFRRSVQSGQALGHILMEQLGAMTVPWR